MLLDLRLFLVATVVPILAFPVFRTQNINVLIDEARSNGQLLSLLGQIVNLEYNPLRRAQERSRPIDVVYKSERNLAHLNRDKAHLLFDGDMLVSKEFLQDHVKEYGKQRRRDLDGSRSNRQAYRDRYYPSTIWSDGIPYVFDTDLPPVAVTSLKRAMVFWQANTCVTFRPKQNETQYVFYTGQESGCFSTVGLDTSQPQQPVNIGPGCYHFGVTSHEVAHAIGLFHHQQRFDRDTYITFNSNNVPFQYMQNFAKISAKFLSTYDTPYDVGSVMHYTPTEFAIDNFKPALESSDVNMQGTMGSMDMPSFLDVLLVNRHYNCGDVCGNGTNVIKCYNGGYPNPLNCTECKCPPSFGGTICNKIETSNLPCGGLLPSAYYLQKINIKLMGGPTRSQCVYQIRAPANRRIMIGIENIQGKCQEGCYTAGVEIKMTGDFRPVGYRFCCLAHSFRRLVSRGEAVPLTFYATNASVNAVLYFRWVIDSPDAEDTLSLTTAQTKEVYKQTNLTYGVDMQISSGGQDISNFVVPSMMDDGGFDRSKNFRDEDFGVIGEFGSDGESYKDFSVYD